MAGGKVDEAQEARNYSAGLKLTSPSQSERAWFASAAQAHALLALVEEVRGLNRRMDDIGPILQDMSRRSKP